MDLASILGLVFGLVFILLGILSGGSLVWFIDMTSVFIVIGGTLGSMMLKFPMNQITGAFPIFMNAIFAKESNPKEIVQMMVQFAESARKEGLLVLEKSIKELDNEFVKGGMQLAIDGTEPEILKEILEKDLENLEERHKAGRNFFDALGELSPAWGMIGTLIGLVNMLMNMSDPSQIGPAMAVCLLTTLYGAIIANFICTPVSGKLEIRTKDEVMANTMIIDGILSIQAGDNPRLVEFKLNTYLKPVDRDMADE